MRNYIPRVLVVLLVAVAIASAALGASGFGATSGAPGAGTADLEGPVFVGMEVGAAVRLARNDGVVVRLWWVPAGARAGTVIQQVSYRPDFLVVSTGPLKDRHAVLPEALGPPVRAECASGFELEPDGDAGPTTCRGRRVNVATWDYFAASQPPMLALGRTATECEVAQSYDGQLTVPMNLSVYELADAYYGWRFGPKLAGELARSGTRAGGCTGA